MPAKVVVMVPLPDAVLSQLSEHYVICDATADGGSAERSLQTMVADADAILCSVGNPVTAQLLEVGKNLKVVSSVSVGVDHVDIAAATKARIPVGYTPGVLVDSTADLALGLMLAASRRIAEGDRFIRAGGWGSGWSTGFFLGTDLTRSTVGLIGLGPIGQAVAKRLHAFGSKVVGWTRSGRSVDGVASVDLDDLMACSDIVSIHAAYCDETHHLVDKHRLAQMPDGATLINTARGGLVDELALINELDSGRLRAGLDVFAVEPLPADSPLRHFDNVVMTPHVGSATAKTRHAMMARALDNLAEGLAGKPLSYCANETVYAAT